MRAFLTAPILSAAYSAFGLVNSLFILYPTFLSLELPLPIGRDAAGSASSDENSLKILFSHSLTLLFYVKMDKRSPGLTLRQKYRVYAIQRRSVRKLLSKESRQCDTPLPYDGVPDSDSS